jgi:antitoxin component YwqK of YwqJK toxin-antitoxin module
MKKFFLAAMLIGMLVGCGPSSEDFKYYKGVRVQKDGSVSPVGDVLDINNLPQDYHKVLFDKNDKVKQDYYVVSGRAKRSSDYLYDDNGKIEEARHYVKGKYNGVSKYVYKEDGTIEKEELYDHKFKFLYSKAF